METCSEGGLDVGVSFVGLEQEKGRGEAWKLVCKDFVRALGESSV